MTECDVFTGFGAVTSLLLEKGKDVTLNLMVSDASLKGDVVIMWKFNDNINVVRFIPDQGPRVSPPYSGRTEFTRNSFSIILKNLREADSGVYTAVGTGMEHTRTLARYNLTVQGGFVNISDTDIQCLKE